MGNSQNSAFGEFTEIEGECEKDLGVSGVLTV
jgi:hypothetical protein